MCAQATSLRLRDDTEEDLLGTDWHQRAINSLYTNLDDIARREGLPWHVGNQLTLVAWNPDGTAWRPSPDIMVHPSAGPASRKEMVARTDGVPALVIEVSSESTWAYDVDDTGGKAAGYMALGVLEYLAFDPTGEYLRTPCRGWRRVGDSVEAWAPDVDGRYVSALGISFHPDDDRLRVFGRDGRPMPYEYEKTRELDERARELDERARELDERARAVAERDAEIARLNAALARLRDQGQPSGECG